MFSEMVPVTPHSTPSFGSSSFSVSSHDASQDRSNDRIRRVDIATGETTTLAGSGTRGFGNGAGASAQFNSPSGVAIDRSGTFALIAVHCSPAPPPSYNPAYQHLLAHAAVRNPFPSPRRVAHRASVFTIFTIFTTSRILSFSDR